MSVKAVEEVPVQAGTDDFQTLEDKIYRTIESLKASRDARGVAERDNQRLREQMEEREEEIETLQREVTQLRRERDEIRSRVEKMLQQIDKIAEEEVAS